MIEQSQSGSHSILHIDGVRKVIGSFALGPIDAQLETGAVHALVGANGSGKSTLLNVCMNLLKPQTGEITIQGLNFQNHDHEIRRLMAYVPEPFDGCEHLTPIEMERMIGKWYPEWDKDQFYHIAEKFNLPLKRKFHRFSQGQRKKTGLVIAFASQAPLVLLDEPTNGLDINSRQSFYQLVNSYMETGERTVWMASHAVDDIQRLADYIYILKAGQMQGPYEKDQLPASWRKYWFSADQQIPTNIPGEVLRNSGAMQELITSQAEQAERFFQEQAIPILDQQPVSLEFVLDFMVRSQNRE